VPDSICPWVVVGRGESALGSQGPPRRLPELRFFLPQGSRGDRGGARPRADRCEAGRVEAVFVNAALSGVQQRQLEQAWGKRVVDRVGLIIDIFGAHAASREAKLQVELAALQYQRSRLVRQRSPDSGSRKGFGEQGSRGGECTRPGAQGEAPWLRQARASCRCSALGLGRCSTGSGACWRTCGGRGPCTGRAASAGQGVGAAGSGLRSGGCCGVHGMPASRRWCRLPADPQLCDG